LNLKRCPRQVGGDEEAVRHMVLDMVIGIGNLVALICIVTSIIFAVATHQATNALWWALLAIFAVLWWDARAPRGRS